MEAKLDTEYRRAHKELCKLRQRHFACEADARQKLQPFEERLRFHQLESACVTSEAYRSRPGRPGEGETPSYRYRITAKVMHDEEVVQKASHRAGRFVLATSIVDEQDLPAEEALEAYLEREMVEGSFRVVY